jgi:hypothetical protein
MYLLSRWWARVRRKLLLLLLLRCSLQNLWREVAGHARERWLTIGAILLLVLDGHRGSLGRGGLHWRGRLLS